MPTSLRDNSMFFQYLHILIYRLADVLYPPNYLKTEHVTQSCKKDKTEKGRFADRGSLMGNEGSCLPSCQTNLVIVLHALLPLFWHYINTTAYLLGRYKPSTPSTPR